MSFSDLQFQELVKKVAAIEIELAKRDGQFEVLQHAQLRTEDEVKATKIELKDDGKALEKRVLDAIDDVKSTYVAMEEKRAIERRERIESDRQWWASFWKFAGGVLAIVVPILTGLGWLVVDQQQDHSKPPIEAQP